MKFLMFLLACLIAGRFACSYIPYFYFHSIFNCLFNAIKNFKKIVKLYYKKVLVSNKDEVKAYYGLVIDIGKCSLNFTLSVDVCVTE